MPWREHEHQRVALKDRWPVGFGVAACLLGVVMFLRGAQFVFLPGLGYQLNVVITYVFGLWALPYTINGWVLMVVGVMTVLEGAECFHSWRVTMMIRATAVVVWWSFTLPATWNTFIHTDVTPVVNVGAISTHIPLGIAYTFLAWKARRRVLDDAIPTPLLDAGEDAK